MKIMRKINHKRILRLFDKIKEGTTIMLITNFCEGGNLEDFILSSYPKGVGETVAVQMI